MSKDLLIDAIRQRNYMRVVELLDSGIDVNAQTSNGETPLRRAVIADDAAIVQLLLQRGANINGAVYLRQAMYSQCSPDVVSLLLQHGTCVSSPSKQEPALHLAARYNQACVSVLIAGGADVNERLSSINHNETALHWAVINGESQAAVRALLGAGCDGEAIGYKGLTPLLYFIGFAAHLMPMADAIDFACLLIACGARVDAVDGDGRNVFNHIEARAQAAFSQFRNVARELVALFTVAWPKDVTRIGGNADEASVAAARRRISRKRVDLIRQRASDVCIGLQSFELPALVTVCILEFACEPFANCVPFHALWNIAVAVKHFTPAAVGAV